MPTGGVCVEPDMASENPTSQIGARNNAFMIAATSQKVYPTVPRWDVYPCSESLFVRLIILTYLRCLPLSLPVPETTGLECAKARAIL